MQDGFRGVWVCWTGALKRAQRQIEAGDIAVALAWYRQETGLEPRFVQLHPKCAALAGEAPVGIRVSFSAGCSMWQVQLADVRPMPAGMGDCGQGTTTDRCPMRADAEEDGKVDRGGEILPTPPCLPPSEAGIWPLEPLTKSVVPNSMENSGTRIMSTSTTARRGRRPIEGIPHDLVRRWHAQGMGAKKIAQELGEKGISVSYRTVARRLKQEAAISIHPNS